MIGLWILLAALFLYLLCGFIGFCKACARAHLKDGELPEFFRSESYRPYLDELLAARANMEKIETEPLRVVAYDGKILRGRLWDCEDAKGTIALFHGYHSTAAYDYAVAAPYFHSLGYRLLLVDQRAHGKSEGRIITYGAKERLDVLSWVTYLGQLFGEEAPIFLAGISMGASTVLMASEFEFPANVRGITADCGFTSPDAIIRHVARQSKIPSFIMPSVRLSAMLFGGFDLKGCSTVEAVSNARYPILFVHGQSDTFVPWEMTQAAYDACQSEKELILVPNAAHGISYLVERERVQKAFQTFLEKHNGALS